MNGKTWLVLRVAERPVQKEGVISFPIYNKEGKIEVLSFDKSDPQLDMRDPRVIGFKGQNYLTTMSYRKHPIKDDYPGCWGVATFASNTKSHDDKGRGRPGDCLLRREQDQLQTAPV